MFNRRGHRAIIHKPIIKHAGSGAPYTEIFDDYILRMIRSYWVARIINFSDQQSRNDEHLASEQIFNVE